MDKFNVKSILLGMGLGIIITAIVCLIYFQGSGPVSEPSEQQMANLAEKYGYVKQNSQDSSGSIFIDSSTKASTETSVTK